MTSAAAALATTSDSVELQRDVALTPVMNVQLAKERLAALQAFCNDYLQPSADGGEDGGDYGVIPGAGKKKVLFKSGADKLCDVYGLKDTYVIVSKTEDFDRNLFDYVLECRLLRRLDDLFVGTGLGSCSSYESKYRWRDRRRTCPKCGQPDTIIRAKADYGGGWLCWAKKGGCNAKFVDTDSAILGQAQERIENPDLADLKNTVLKIAKKRAKIDAVIAVTRSSGLFSQDVEDLEDDNDKPAKPKAKPKPASGAAPKTFEPDIRTGPVVITRVVPPWPDQKGNAKAFLFHSAMPPTEDAGLPIYQDVVKTTAEACLQAKTPVQLDIVRSASSGRPYVKAIVKVEPMLSVDDVPFSS